MRASFRAVLFASVFPVCAFAGEFPVPAPAVDVTIYADGAVVHRQGAIDLAAGSHVLKIEGVGASMVEQSLRIGGSGAIEIQSIAVGHALVPRRSEVDALLEAQRKTEAELAQAQGRQRDLYEVRVSVEAAKGGRAGLDLTYRVPDASWASVYDMRLDSAAGKLTIEQDAAVTQDSGEDWSRVALTLTTARSVEGTVHTDLWGTESGLRDPNAQVMANMVSMSAPAPAPSPMATRKLASVQPGEFTSDFKIEGGTDLPNGIVEKRLPVSVQHLDAMVELLGVPDFDTHPAIQVSFVNGQDMPITGGKVGLYRDGSYIGTGSVLAAQPGEKTSLIFGADQAVTMKLTQTANQHGEAGAFTSDNILMKGWTVVVRNNHKHPVKVTLLGRIPTSTDEGLKIEPTGAAANPTKSGLNGPGVFSNELQIGATEEKSVAYGFKARWPKDRQLTGAPL